MCEIFSPISDQDMTQILLSFLFLKCGLEVQQRLQIAVQRKQPGTEEEAVGERRRTNVAGGADTEETSL